MLEHLFKVAPAGAPDPSSAKTPGATAAADAAREFEALFLLQMLKQMRQSMLDETETEGDGFGGAALFDTIDSALARALAGRSGIAPVFEAPLTNLVGGASTPGAVSDRPASPLAGRVTSAFGWRSDPLNGATRFHAGVDIAAAYGRDVPAAAAGTVVFAGERGGYGNCVTVEHPGGIQTRYAHLSAVNVREGDAIGAGQSIGRVGQSGRATGPHLHFEVLRNGAAVDPQSVSLKFGPAAVDYPSGSSRHLATALGASHED